MPIAAEAGVQRPVGVVAHQCGDVSCAIMAFDRDEDFAVGLQVNASAELGARILAMS